MTKQVFSQTKNHQKETFGFSNDSDGGMFQSRPFVVQSKAGEEGERSELKTSLMRAEHYGHHLSQMQPVGFLAGTNVIQRSPSKRKKPDSPTERTKSKRAKYGPGQHGYKTNEQKFLSGKYGFPVSGDTHESEHPIGFEVLNRTSGLERGTSGCPRVTALENMAPAYQEVKSLHRDHIGTGSKKETDASGFNSTSYRDTQRSLTKARDISSGVQINQSAYASNPKFKDIAKTREGQAATDSFNAMVKNMNSVTYAENDKNITVPVDEWQRQEMLLSREIAMTGKWGKDKNMQDKIAASRKYAQKVEDEKKGK